MRRFAVYSFQLPTSDGQLTLTTQNISFLLLGSFNWFTQACKKVASTALCIYATSYQGH